MEDFFLEKKFFLFLQYFVMRLPGIPGSLKHSPKRLPNLIPGSKKKFIEMIPKCVYIVMVGPYFSAWWAI